MELELTRHADHVLRRRGIHLSWVRSVVATPLATEQDERDESLEHRLGKIEEYGNRVLRVIINRNVEPPRIVTAFFDRSMRDKL
jgi:uncharacterized protein DUF4258